MNIEKIANIISDYYDEDPAGRWLKCAQHIAAEISSGAHAQAPLPPLADRDELIALLEDLASVNLSREACSRQARRMADDLIARGLALSSTHSGSNAPKYTGTYLGYKDSEGREMHCANAFCPHLEKCVKGCAHRVAHSSTDRV